MREPGTTDDGKRAVLEGEVVVYDPKKGRGEDRDYSYDRSKYEEQPRGPKRKYNASTDPDTIAECVRERLRGVSLRKLAEKYGVAHETIRRWAGQNTETTRISISDILNVRAQLYLELDVVKYEAWKIYEDYDHPKLKLDAMARVESILRAQIDLSGAKAPTAIKADVTVTELTQEDLAVRDLVESARAREALQMADIEAEFKAGG